jgi:hypothetical protein
MVTTLAMLCALVWLLVLIYHIEHRGFVVFLCWLFIAPVAANLVNEPGTNPFFRRQRQWVAPVSEPNKSTKQEAAYITAPTTTKLNELLEPTRLLFGVFFAVFLLQAVLKKRLLPLDRAEIWMFAFSVVLVVGAFRSLRVAYSMRMAVDAFIVPFLVYYTARRLVTSEDRLRKLTQVVGGVGFYVIGISLIERLTSSGLYYRLGGPFLAPTPLYVVITLVFFIMLSEALGGERSRDGKQLFSRGIRLFVLWLAPVIVLLTWARATWLGLLVSVGIFLCMAARLTNLSRKLVVISLTLLLLAGGIIGLQTSASQEIVSERVTDKTQTIYARLGAWQLILQEVGKAPFFGIGLNDLRAVLSTTRIRVEGIKSEENPHNSFLSILAELGAGGLLTYLAIGVSILRMGLGLYREGTHVQDRWRGVMIVVTMAAYFVPALFVNSLYLPTSSNIYVYGFVGGIAGLYDRDRRRLFLNPYASHARHQQMNIGMTAAARRRNVEGVIYK